MTADDFELFAEMWIQAWAICGKTPTAGAIRFSFEVLRGYDARDIGEALAAHATDPDSGQYPPKPADVVRHLRGGKAHRAVRAFDLAITAAGRAGPYRSAVFDDPLIHAVISDTGGWVSWCQQDLGERGEKRGFAERDFCKRYEGYLLRPPANYPRKLIGITESGNTQRGYLGAIQAPTLIGDPDLAEQVFLGGADRRLSIEHQQEAQG